MLSMISVSEAMILIVILLVLAIAGLWLALRRRSR